MTLGSGKKDSPGSHTQQVPDNLLRFMLQNWRPAGPDTSRALPDAARHLARRQRLSQRFPGELLVIPSGQRKVRANDTYYPFRPGSDFFYLTGAVEPDGVLALVPRGRDHEHLLFVEPDPGKTDATFFTDRVKGALWNGPGLGIMESQRRYAIACAPLEKLHGTLLAQMSGHNIGVRVLRGFAPSLAGIPDVSDPEQVRLDQELAAFLAEVRLIKDESEIRHLQSAIRATHRGFEDVIARLKTAKTERELEGVFWTRARVEGNDVGYTSIVGSGHHACTLHWNRNDGPIRSRDLLLLDAGVEGRSLYTADITRTLPVSGKFSPEQRAVYEVVLQAQRAALKCVRPGEDFMTPNRAAMSVLTQGLVRLGVLRVPAEEALRDENQLYRRYTLHNISHMLGLDVHDCAQARAETYKFGQLQPGMVLTVEPGLYFQCDDLTVPARYRGIGVRIEDDVLVTAKGHRVLSNRLPRETAAVEAWMRDVWRRP